MIKKRKMIMSIAASALFGFMAGCGDKEPQSAQSAGKGGGPKGMMPTVSVIPAALSSISEVIQLTGTAEPVRVARLASPVEGPVQTLWAREGDTVRAGRKVMDIGRKGAANAQLVAAREYLQKQEQELERVKMLVADGALPESDLDAARAQYETARAQHARAAESAGDFRIQAPWGGIVAEVFVKEGDFVAPRTPLLEMYDPAKLVIVSSVAETRAVEIHEQDLVEVHFDAYPGRTFKGSVGRMYPRLDGKTRTRTFEVSVHEPIDLIPGMFARLNVEIARADSALVIAENAVVTTPKGDTVVYVVEGNTAVARKVVIGVQSRNKMQITDGLRAGDKVIVSGNEKLKNGAPVRIAGGKDRPGAQGGAQGNSSGEKAMGDAENARKKNGLSSAGQGTGK